MMETTTELTKLPQNLQKRLENVIKKEGYVTYKVDTQSADAPGTSFLSRSYAVAVKGETKDGEKESFIFIKGIFTTDTMDKIMDLSQAFAAEAFVYNELYSVFTELQHEAGIPAEERFKIIRSYGESGSEGIIMENVVVQGYKTYERTYTMAVEDAEMALTEIAKFHALSSVIKAKRPDYYEKKIKSQKHTFRFGKEWHKGTEHVARLSAKHVTGVARERLEKMLPKFSQKWEEHQLDQTSAGTCLCHGDFRLGNLMAKHTGNKLEDLYVVDYQLISYGCPINDILFMIFSGSDQKFRRQHLDRLIQFYYTAFRSFLKKFDLDSEDFYPKKEYLKDFKSRLDYGLVIALYFIIFFWADDEVIPDLSKQDMKDLDFAVEDGYSEIIQGIVEDFVEWGYL